MKKRVLSIILAIVMIVSVFPMGVLAADEAQDDAAEMRLHAMLWDDEAGTTVEREFTDWSIGLFDSWEIGFYLHNADGSSTLLSAEDLSFPEYLDVEPAEKEGWYTIEGNNVGSGYISYGDYSVKFDMLLPDLGLYSGKPFDVSTLVESISLTADSNVFYIALNPETVASGFTITEIHSSFGSEIRNPAIQEIADVVLSDDGSYATVTINNMDADGSFHFEADISRSNGMSSTWGRSIRINNEMPRLYFCYLDMSGDEYIVNCQYPNSERYPSPGYSDTGCFYFASRSDIVAGKAAPLSIDELSFPAYTNVEYFEDDGRVVPTNSIRVETTRFSTDDDTTEIVYEANGNEYAMTFLPVLPDIGFYTEPTASVEAYIYDRAAFLVDEDNRSFYICPSNTDECKVLSVDSWRDADMFTTTPSVDASGAADGRYIKVTVKDDCTVADRHYTAVINYQYMRHDEWVDNTQWVSVCLENGQPALVWRHMEWDQAKQEWVETNGDVNSSLYLAAGDDMVIQFLYGFGENYIPVDFEDLTFPTNILSGYISEGALRVKVTAYEGSGDICYLDPDTGKVLSRMHIELNKPDFALYSSPVADKSGYLGRTLEVNGAGDVFYLVAADGRSITAIEGIRQNYSGGSDASDYFDIQISDDGSYATIKIKKNAEGNLPIGTNYVLMLTQPWGTRFIDFDLVRMDLQQLSTPTGLAWHREYYWNASSADDYTTRMGSMSFAAGELFQNRILVEIYSAADNYSAPVHNGGWHFGDMNQAGYFSITDFIYNDLPSGTYKFRILAEGDGTVYRNSEWSELSEAWTYTAPAAQLTAPDSSKIEWVAEDGRYYARWPQETQDGVGYYEVYWYYEDTENGNMNRVGGTFDISAEYMPDDGYLRAYLHDDIVHEHGNVPYYFKVRCIPSDITKYRFSPFSDFSEPLDTTSITDKVNDKLDTLIPDTSAGEETTVEDIQTALADDTADLRQAMAADLSISGGANSGTIDRIKELEDTVANDVDQVIEAKNSAPQQIKDIAADIEMVGATLNLADKNPESGKTPTVTLEIDEPKEGIVIPEQQHNAVQFSMKLNGAIDKDDKEQAGQQLVVPVVIDMPVPENINPHFLVVLHKLWNGEIEQMWPNIYWSETEERYRATFVVDSFSDFALLEYNFAFDVGEVEKTEGDAPFTIAPSGAAAGSTVTYTSSNPNVASVNPLTGEVTIHGHGIAVITATAGAIGIYPEAETSYILVVAEKPEATKYQVILEDCANGGITADIRLAAEGETVTVTAVAATGFKLAQIAVLDESGNRIELTPVTSTSGSFVMPAGDVHVKAVFIPAGAAPAPNPGPAPAPKPEEPEKPEEPKPEEPKPSFTDVSEDAYYFDTVQWAVENGITTGTSDTSFSPNAGCTRAQAVTFLWRAAGCPAPKSADMPFTDVAKDAYYYDAVLWALENGITTGTSGTAFSPNAECTRAQIVTFLWRAQGSADSSADAGFTDVAKDAYYAAAVEWAVENGVTNGTAEGVFSPADNCVRAQIVTFMYRCMAE